jgi:hypothetical protein
MARGNTKYRACPGYPNDFPDLNPVAERLLDFQYYSETTARPFGWKFTRHDLAKLLAKHGTPHGPKIR